MNKDRFDILGIPLFHIPMEFGTEEEWIGKYPKEILFKEFTSDENGEHSLPRKIGLHRIRKIGGYSNLYRRKLESDYLEYLTYEKAHNIYGESIPYEIDSRLKYELYIIKVKGMSNYFLFVQDFVSSLTDLGSIVFSFWGKDSGSMVAYCLGITKVNPLEYDLLFEYYLNTDSDIIPLMTILIDWESEKLVNEWLMKKYGGVYWKNFICTHSTSLSFVRKLIEEIKKKNNVDFKWDDIPLDDRNALNIFKRGDYDVVWSFGDPKKLCWKFKPSSFADLIILAAFQTTGLWYYLDIFYERKMGSLQYSYDIPYMEKFLNESCGILLYEEQLILLSRLIADFTRLESIELIEVLRHGRSKKQKMAEKFIKGGTRNGHDKNVLLKIWSDWCRYSKCIIRKTSIVSDVWLSYILTFYKVYYPEEFDSVLAK